MFVRRQMRKEGYTFVLRSSRKSDLDLAESMLLSRGHGTCTFKTWRGWELWSRRSN